MAELQLYRASARASIQIALCYIGIDQVELLFVSIISIESCRD